MPKFLNSILKILLFAFVSGALLLLGLIYYYSKDLPDYSALQNYHPPAVTRIYSADGKLIEEYAKEYRIFVPIENIPKSLIEAFLAAEDRNFYEHYGVDIPGVIRAAFANVGRILKGKRMEGASTITQQVVKNFFLNSEQSIARKVKEAVLSYRISRTFTKNQILELYLNQMYLGKGAYGVAAASQAYFNKTLNELTLPEAALLAALPKAPSTFNPEKKYERVFLRRNYVISRMIEDGYVTQEAGEEAMASPITSD
ncbi:MAG UNVERIFIED_CONTAM: transglycosylase domain-containing protein [Rickettsiaceae bacterium]